MTLYLVRGSKILLTSDGALPDEAPPAIAISEPIPVTPDGTSRTARALGGSRDDPAPEGFAWTPLRALFLRDDEEAFGRLARAVQLAEWDETHAFCGRCGAETTRSARERVRECPRCGLPAWPRISPVVIVRIDRGDEILLARSGDRPMPFFSILAGFVEPGETLEQALAREVREEVGIEVRDVAYCGSQPWPFPHSLMVGFKARWASGEIRIDGKEIAEAAWFRADALPPVPPPQSIAGRLIEEFVREQTAG